MPSDVKSVVPDRAYQLLEPDEPAPVEVVNACGTSVFVLTCEHAGRLLPRRLGTLGLDPSQLQRHIAWDIGIAGVSRRLSSLLAAPLVMQRYSRLVADCNRSPGADDYIAAISEATPIPGNTGLTAAEIEARTTEIHAPYHAAIRRILDQRSAAGRSVAVVAMHSFTPVYHGVSRPWQIGVLHEQDRRFGSAVLDVLAGDYPGLVVGDNQPYRLEGLRDYSLAVHGHGRGLHHVELEIRQDLIDTDAGQAEWAERLSRVLPDALESLSSAE